MVGGIPSVPVHNGHRRKGSIIRKLRRYVWMFRFGISMIVVLSAFSSILFWTKIKEVMPVTPEIFSKSKLIIDIPLHYEITMDMKPEIITYENVGITGYTNREEETDKSPNIGADGRQVCEGTIAVSQDWFRKKIFPGDKVYIEKLKKWYLCEDTMNPRHQGRGDVFFYKRHLTKEGLPKPFNGSFVSDIVVVRVLK